MTNYLTSLRGTLANASVGEIFSHSLAIQSNASQTTVATAVASTWEALWNGVSNLKGEFPSTVVYTEAVAAVIIDLASGKVSAAYHAPITAGAGGAAGNESLPTQNALVVSLLAGVRANGTPMRGRFYLPSLDRSVLNADGTVLSQVQSGIADVMQQWIQDLAAQGHTACVWSRTEARMAIASTLRVGNRVDTVRSRRNKGQETYVALPVLG
jgi:hypothetical protein